MQLDPEMRGERLDRLEHDIGERRRGGRRDRDRGEPTGDLDVKRTVAHLDDRHAIEELAVEAKRPKGKLTERQAVVAAHIVLSGAKVFVIDSLDGVKELEQWLDAVVNVSVPSPAGSSAALPT